MLTKSIIGLKTKKSCLEISKNKDYLRYKVDLISDRKENKSLEI